MTGILNALIAGVSGAVKDAYFNLVSLLLPGNGTNGANNNFFLDSSSNNFTITRNPTSGPNAPTQGTFSPFSQTGWGNYFDGSNDSLTIPSGSSISGTGNFTVECWMYPLTFASGYRVFYANETSGGLSLLINSTGTLSYGRALVAVDGTTTGTVNFNQWNHVAFVRSGTGSNQFICYINGQSAGSFTNSTSYSSGIVRIGTDGGGINYPFPGYLSNIRSVIIAVYTGNFTPPIAPLTATQSAGTNISAITGTQTSLLTCQSNRFIDNSSNNFTVTANNGPSVVAFSPFAPTAAYTTAAVGGSGYFDGNGDFLSLPTNTATALGSSNFTAESWVYPDGSPPSTGQIIGSWDGASTLSWTLAVNTNASVTFAYTTSGVYGPSTSFTSSANAVVINSWNHVAAVRTSGTIIVYINGLVVINQSIAGTLYSAPNNTKVGSNSQPQPFKGYLAGTRLVVGTAVYSGTSTTTPNFTLPTVPLDAVTNTALLLNYINAGITDATAKNDLETVGNAQISTSVSKFPGGSIAFNASANTYLSQNPATTDMYAFGSGDFTIECWLYLNSTTGIQTLYDGRPNGSANAAVPTIYITSGSIRYYVSAVDRITGSTLSTGQWYHIAIARSGGSTRMFINGTQAGSTYTDSTVYLNSANRPFIGGDSNSLGSNLLNGYIDDLRITKGYARYVTGTGANAGQMVFNGTNTLALPTAPFPVQ